MSRDRCNIYKRASPAGYPRILEAASARLEPKGNGWVHFSLKFQPRNLIGPNGASTSIINRVQNINDTVTVFQKLN